MKRDGGAATADGFPPRRTLHAKPMDWTDVLGLRQNPEVVRTTPHIYLEWPLVVGAPIGVQVAIRLS